MSLQCATDGWLAVVGLTRMGVGRTRGAGSAVYRDVNALEWVASPGVATGIPMNAGRGGNEVWCPCFVISTAEGPEVADEELPLEMLLAPSKLRAMAEGGSRSRDEGLPSFPTAPRLSSGILSADSDGLVALGTASGLALVGSDCC
jgi:hypothetical protein